MPTYKLNIIAEGKDRASGPLGKVGGALGGVATIAGGIIAAQLFTKIASGILDIGVSSLVMAGDVQETLSKANATFGSFTQGTTQSLDRFAEETGRSRFELLGMATDMGAVAKAMGFTDEQASDLATQITTLAVDVGSFNNIPSADVADRFTRALTGEFDSLKEVGIVINQNRINQELANRGITESWQNLDQYTRAQIIAGLITESASDAIGDAAKTSDSFANRMVALKAAVDDTKTEIGLALLPAVEDLLGVFLELWQKHGPAVTSFFTNVLVPAISTVVDAISNLLSGNTNVSLTDLIPDSLKEGFDSLSAGAEGLAASFREHWPAIQEAVQEVVTWAQTNVVPVISSVFLAVGDILGALAKVFSEHGETIIGIISIAFKIISTTILGAITLVVGVVNSALALLRGDWEGAWQAIKDAVEKFLGLALSIVGVKLDEFTKTWRTNLELALLIVKTVLGNIVKTITGFIGKFVDAGKALIQGLGRGIQDAVASLLTTLAGALQDVIDLTNKIFGSSSPSKVFEGIGGDVMAGMERGLMNGLPGVENILGSLMPNEVASTLIPDGITTPGGIANAGGRNTSVTFNITGGNPEDIARQISRTLKLQGIQI